MIDRFLADASEPSAETLLPLPAEAVDYTSVLEEEVQAGDTVAVAPLRGQELIDSFIEKNAKEEEHPEEKQVPEEAGVEEPCLPSKEEKEGVPPSEIVNEVPEVEEEENYFTETWLKFMLNNNDMIKHWKLLKN